MLISKSDFYNLCKSMGKDPEFEKLRAEVLSILKKQAKTEGNEKDIHKSLEEMDKSFKYFDKDEFIIKSGYPVGTIREWKGRKYIKVAPNKWKPKYDSESKGAKNSITRLMKQVENCKNVEELMNLVMENKQRFTDANGNHLPIVDKLRAAVDRKNEKLSGEPTTYVDGVGEDVKRERKADKKNDSLSSGSDKNVRNPFNMRKTGFSITARNGIEQYKEQKKILNWDLDKQKKKIEKEYDFSDITEEKKNTFLKPKFDKLEMQFNAAKGNIEYIKQELQEIANMDGVNNIISKMKAAGIYDEVMEEAAEKKESPKAEEKKESSSKKKTFEQEMDQLNDAQDEAWEGFDSGSDIKATPENSKKFYERVKKFVDDNNIKLSKKHRDEIEENNGHSFNEALALAGAYGAEEKEKALARNKEYSKKYKGSVLDLSKIDEFKENESEAEKHKNRSDAMKGNKNAYKGGPDEVSKYINGKTNDFKKRDSMLADAIRERYGIDENGKKDSFELMGDLYSKVKTSKPHTDGWYDALNKYDEAAKIYHSVNGGKDIDYYNSEIEKERMKPNYNRDEVAEPKKESKMSKEELKKTVMDKANDYFRTNSDSLNKKATEEVEKMTADECNQATQLNESNDLGRFVDKFDKEGKIPTDKELQDFAYNVVLARIATSQWGDKHRKELAEQNDAEAKKKEEESIQKENEIKEKYHGYFDNRKGLDRARDLKSLEKKYNYDGKVMSQKEFVEQSIDNGAEVKEREVNKIDYPSRTRWNRMTGAEQDAYERKIKEAGKVTKYLINGYEIPKAVSDYAKYYKENVKSDENSSKDIKSMSDDDLNNAISERNSKIKELSEKNTKLYDKHNGFGADGAEGKDYEEWLSNHREINKLQDEAAKYSIERGKRKAAKADTESKKKVNGYGEATDREITSGTYERAEKRRQKDVDNFLGVKKGLFEEDEETDIAETVRSVLSEII